MTTITIDIPTFRAMFPRFANVTTYPDAYVQMQFDAATTIISADVGCVMPANARTRALYLVVAHLLTLDAIINAGGAPGIVLSSKVGDVSVTLAAPPYGTDAWRYWFSLTPWGQQLLMLLSAQAVGLSGFDGNPEREGFRRIGGGFGAGPGGCPDFDSSPPSSGVPWDDGILWS